MMTTPPRQISVLTLALRCLPSDKVLQHGTLACALTTDHSDLGQIELHVHAQLGEGILQLVDDRYQLLHAHVTGHCHGVAIRSGG